MLMPISSSTGSKKSRDPLVHGSDEAKRELEDGGKLLSDD